MGRLSVPRHLTIAVLTAVGLSLAAGCATFPPPKEAIATSRTYGKSYNDVWDAVLATFADLDIPVKSMEKESGTIVAEDDRIELRQFEPGRFDSKDSFCGSPERHHFLRTLVGSYRVSVTRWSEIRSSLNLSVSYRASTYFGEQFTGWHPCVSKGVFEPRFFEQLESRLQSGRGPAGPSRDLDWWKPSKGY